MSLKAIAEQELARLRAGEMGHETEEETRLKQVKQPVSCFIDASSRFTPMKHDPRQKTANNETCFTVSFPRGETHETGLATDTVAGVERLRTMRPPRLMKPDSWLVAVASAVYLIDNGWAAKALALGWSPLSLFGAVTDATGDPFSDGLAVWLNGRKLAAMTATCATVEDGNGRYFYNRREQVGAKLLWEIGR